jgi:isopenicillin-N epimerase
MRTLFLLHPDIVFLNHGSYGACPRPVFEEYQHWQRVLEQDPVDFFQRRLQGQLAEARAALAAYVGAGVDDLVYVPNTTYGINAVARSLRLQHGDEVLLSNHEYGAIDRAWRFVCGRRGARLRRQTLELPVTTVAAAIEQIWSGVTPQTRVICLSHISSATALILPVAEICRRARAAGIITVIDGAHVPGQIPLDVSAIGADFYVGNCHKWLCAPKGAAFLYVRPEYQAALDPLVVSWGWQSENPGPSQFIDYFEYQGTNDLAAYLSVPAAIAFQDRHNWPAQRADCHELLRDARQRILNLTGLEPIAPDSSDWWMQMCALPLPPPQTTELMRRLWENHRIEIPVTRHNGRYLLRVSVQAYNQPTDIDALLAALTVEIT